MADWSEQFQAYDPSIISVASEFGVGLHTSSGSVVNTATWPVTNQAYYIPFKVRERFVAVQMFCVNGTATAGSVDIGIYDMFGNRLVNKGSTAQGTATSVQTFDITDTTLQPGMYFMALNCDNTTSAFNRWTMSVQHQRCFGMYQQAVGAITLPATATFAAITTTGYVPFIGLASRTVM